jgi:hypothetical protein
MSVSLVRGAKFGGGTALIFAIITPINNLIRDEPIVLESIVTGSIFAFFVFGLIGTFTDKIGSETGSD